MYEKGFLRRKRIFLECRMSQSEKRVMIVSMFTIPEGRASFKLAYAKQKFLSNIKREEGSSSPFTKDFYGTSRILYFLATHLKGFMFAWVLSSL